MTQRPHKHLYPVIDILVEKAIDDIEADGTEISCRKGCNHCCYLLIEISWEEAMELAHWVLELPEDEREAAIKRIRKNAAEAKPLFEEYDAEPTFTADSDLPDDLYDDYFYGAKRPCPMLVDEICSVYPVRPSSCRIHLVTSPPESCSKEVRDAEDYEIPDRVTELQDEVAPLNDAVCEDSRWGHYGIILEKALDELIAKQA